MNKYNMEVPNTGTIWYANFEHHNIIRSNKERTVLVTDVRIEDKTCIVVKITDAKGKKKNEFNYFLKDWKKDGLSKYSIADASDMHILKWDDLNRYVGDINIEEYKEIRKCILRIKIAYRDNPWTFKSWCIRAGLSDITIDNENKELSGLYTVMKNKEATDADIATIVYDICKDSHNIPRYLILKFEYDDKESYAIFCAFSHRKRMYVFVFYENICNIEGPNLVFFYLFNDIAKYIKKLMFGKSNVKISIYNGYRDERLNPIELLLKKNKSSVTRGLLIDLLTEGEKCRVLNEEIKDSKDLLYVLEDALQNIYLK